MKNVMIEYDPISVRWMSYHTALKSFLEETAGLPNLPKNKSNEGKNVKVVYSTPDTAYVKYVIPMINGLAQYPIISFYLSSEEVNKDNIGNMFKTFEHYQKDEDGNLVKYSFRHPLVKTLIYKANIFTTKMADSDYILTLLELSSNELVPYACRVNGRPAQYYIKNVRAAQSIDYEGKKFIRSEFEIEVPSASVFPVEIETDVDVIKKIIANLRGEQTIIEAEENSTVENV